VGLAIARQLVRTFPSKSTFLVERHGRAGEEISSRNSEVVHAGEPSLGITAHESSTQWYDSPVHGQVYTILPTR